MQKISTGWLRSKASIETSKFEKLIGSLLSAVLRQFEKVYLGNAAFFFFSAAEQMDQSKDVLTPSGNAADTLNLNNCICFMRYSHCMVNTIGPGLLEFALDTAKAIKGLKAQPNIAEVDLFLSLSNVFRLF